MNRRPSAPLSCETNDLKRKGGHLFSLLFFHLSPPLIAGAANFLFLLRDVRLSLGGLFSLLPILFITYFSPYFMFLSELERLLSTAKDKDRQDFIKNAISSLDATTRKKEPLPSFDSEVSIGQV